MVQRQIVVRRLQRSPIPAGQLALLILLPLALISGICLLLGMPLMPSFAALGIFVFTLALAAGMAPKQPSAATAAPQRGRRPAARPRQ